MRGVPDRPGVASDLFTALADQNISVDVIVQLAPAAGHTDLAFTVARTDHPKALRISKDVAQKVGASAVESDEKIAKVSIVGAGMRSHSGVAAKMFSMLAKDGINIQMISTSEIKVSCVIDEKYCELAVRTLHDGFGLGKPSA